MSYTLNFSLALGAGKTGLADLRAQLVDSSGVNSGTVISTGFVEIGSGHYLWNYASFADGFRGGVKFYSNAAPAALLGFAAINPEEAENSDAKTSSRLASASYIAPNNADIAAIKTKTDNLPSDPADHSLLMAEAASILAAIAALNNLSSAGAQAAAAAALAAYDAATGADVASVAATVSATNPDGYVAGEITIQQATTVDRQIVDVSIIPATVTRAVLTVKRNIGDSDSKAILQIDSDVGLTLLNGVEVSASTSPLLPENAALSFSYAAKTVDFHIDDHISALLNPNTLGYWYDVKFYYPTSGSVATAKMKFYVSSVITIAA